MSRILAPAIFIALFSVFSASEKAVASNVKTLVNEGDKKEKQFDNVAALTLYRTAKAADPENFEAAYKTVGAIVNVGEDFLDDAGEGARKRYEEATKLAESLAKKWPDEALSHYYYALASGKLAQSRGGKEKVKLSRQIYNEATKAVELNPNIYRPYLLLGIYHRNVATLSWFLKAFANSFFGGLPPGSLPESVENLNKAIELSPQNVRAHYEMGLTLDEQGKSKEAKGYYKKAIGFPETDHLDSHYKKKAKKKAEK